MSNTLFWIGFGIFAVAFIVRRLVKIKYYQVYKTYGRTNLQRQEIRRIYRPKSFIWIGVEIVGLIISSAVLWLR